MTINDLLIPEEIEYLQQLKKKEYVSLQRSDNGQLFAIKESNKLLIDSTYFSCIPDSHTIHIDYLLTMIAGVEVPVLYEPIKVPVIKYRETISKKRLTEWVELLKNGYYSELRRQIEKEINK